MSLVPLQSFVFIFHAHLFFRKVIAQLCVLAGRVKISASGSDFLIGKLLMTCVLLVVNRDARDKVLPGEKVFSFTRVWTIFIVINCRTMTRCAERDKTPVCFKCLFIVTLVF